MNDHVTPTRQDNDLVERAELAGLSGPGRAALVAFWPHTQKILPSILDGFYGHLAAVPAMQGLSAERIAGIRRAQATHWQRMFAATLDSAYMQSVQSIGRAHVRIGLEPRWTAPARSPVPSPASTTSPAATARPRNRS